MPIYRYFFLIKFYKNKKVNVRQVGNACSYLTAIETSLRKLVDFFFFTFCSTNFFIFFLGGGSLVFFFLSFCVFNQCSHLNIRIDIFYFLIKWNAKKLRFKTLPKSDFLKFQSTSTKNKETQWYTVYLHFKQEST